MPINPQMVFVFLKTMLRFEFFNIKNHSLVFQDTMDHINQESCKRRQITPQVALNIQNRRSVASSQTLTFLIPNQNYSFILFSQIHQRQKYKKLQLFP